MSQVKMLIYAGVATLLLTPLAWFFSVASVHLGGASGLLALVLAPLLVLDMLVFPKSLFGSTGWVLAGHWCVFGMAQFVYYYIALMLLAAIREKKVTWLKVFAAAVAVLAPFLFIVSRVYSEYGLQDTLDSTRACY